MSFQFPNQMTVAQLAERGANMMDEATATMRLASELAEFERLTGRSLVLTETWAVEGPSEGFPQDVDADGPDAGAEQPQGGDFGSGQATVAEKAIAAVAPLSAPLRAHRHKPRNMSWAGLTLAERRIVQHLETLPDDFAVVDDYNIASKLMCGMQLNDAALSIGADPKAVLARWKSFWCPEVLEGKDTPSIDGQKRLLAALNYRMGDDHA